MAVGTHEVEVEVDLVAHGRPATRALAKAIGEAKAAGHPLDPVTVVVPSNTAGLSARRLLTTGDAARGLAPVNLANVAFVTPLRLAELLGSAHMEGRRPLTNPVLASAVRSVLAIAPGMFAGVADHQATVAAVVSVYGELSRTSPSTRSRIAAGGHRGAEVVRVVDEVRSRLSAFYDEDELAEVAAAHAASSEVGTLVWHLPDVLTPALTGLLAAALAAAPRAGVIVGITGDAEADDAVIAAVRRCGIDVDSADVNVETPVATRIVNASDADEEVRQVVREVVDLVAAGTALDRIAVFHPATYRRTLVEQLEGAGVAHHGPAAKRLADSVAGRTLLAALALGRERWGRSAVIGLVAGAPLLAGGRLASTRRWDAVSRRSGVVGGLDDWRVKLATERLRLEAVIADADGEAPPRGPQRREAAARDLETTSLMATFVDDLAAGLSRVEADTTWAARAAGARTLLHDLLGPEQRRSHRWPDAEVAAGQRVEAALARLGALDDMEAHPSFATFESAVVSELDAPAGRVGHFGAGLLVAPLAASVGHDVDAVFVLGMAEGTCPAIRSDDALLPDSDRIVADAGELATQADRLSAQRRAYLAALAAGAGHRVLCYPRGDLRGRRERLPSRWLLESAGSIAGRRLSSRDVAGLPDEVVHVVESYAAGVGGATAHGSVADRDVAVLLASPEPLHHPLVTGDLARGLTARASRSRAAFTEWDGNLAGHSVASPVTGTPMSPSRLETWAACPFKYFLQYVLHLSERDDPERVVEISPAEKGTLVHAVLERFFAEVLARPAGVPEPNQTWTFDDRQRIAAIAEEAFGEVEARGLAGRALTWRRTRAEVMADLDVFLTKDDEHRAGGGLRPSQVEMAFGLDGAEPLTIELQGERTLTFRGKIDRVDLDGDGRAVVSDYKTGSGYGYDELVDDPVRAGRTLQLGVYAEAASSRLSAAEVEAGYWMVSSKGRWARHGYQWTPDRRERFLDVTATIVDGIESGLFPALPGEYESFWGAHENCRFCDFDRVCPRDREDHQRATAEAAELTLLQRLELRGAGEADGDGAVD